MANNIRLHPIVCAERIYCGPAAIAAFTGLDPKGRIRCEINRHRNRKLTTGVMGMYAWEVIAVLRRLGVRCGAPTSVESDNFTIKQYVKRRPETPMILVTCNHFVAANNGWCLDNKSRIPRLAENFPGNQARVKKVIEIYG